MSSDTAGSPAPDDAAPDGGDAGGGDGRARRPLTAVEAALIAEACARSDLIWVRAPGQQRYRAAWHVWHEGAVCLVHGGGEQSLPPLGAQVEVLARSKDTGAALIGFLAEVRSPAVRTPDWDAVAAALAAARLNAPDPQRQRELWAGGGAVISLLYPLAVSVAAHGDDDTPDGRLPAPGGPGTTLTRRPFHLGGRAGRARRRRGTGL